jgi:hypothetical protein
MHSEVIGQANEKAAAGGHTSAMNTLGLLLADLWVPRTGPLPVPGR